MTWRELLFAVTALGRRPAIVKVTVRGARFEVVKTITSPQELAAFAELWWSKVEADPQLWKAAPAATIYALDIVTRHSNRWFYHPSGLIKLLAIWPAIWVAPLYRLPSPAAFNTLLGIEQP
jgi:hypothetical protein